jgi:Skp family chaperone for outer membrane proteins
MKPLSVSILAITFITMTSNAQDMSVADNQCRTEAKEIAIKSYQSCITEARTARLESIRKEYQEKLADLKRQYEGQLQELKKQNPKPEASTATSPTVTLKKAKADKKTAKNQKSSAAKKPVNNIITESELDKSAPPAPTGETATSAAATTVETNSATGETENLQIVDPSLPSEQQ